MKSRIITVLLLNFSKWCNLQDMQSRIRELEQLLGKKTMEAEILKEGIKVAPKKTTVACVLAAQRRYPVKRVSAALTIARYYYHRDRYRNSIKTRLKTSVT